MPDGFAVDLDQLRKHSAATDRIGGRADTASGAGHQVADMDQAYGLLCRPIAWLLKGPQDNCTEAIGSSAETLHLTSQKLNKAADLYQEAEEHTAEVFEKLLKQLDALWPPVVGTTRGGR